MPPEEEVQAETTMDLEEPLLPQQSGAGEDVVPAESDSSGEGHTEATTYLPTGNQEEHQEDARETDNNNDGKDVIVSLCGRRCLKLNHNVLLNLLLAILYGMSDSLWTGTVLVAYLKRLGREQNRPVGDIEAVNGLAVLVSALPVGYLADTYGRDVLIRAGGMLFIGTALLHAATMVWIGTDEEALSERQQTIALILLGIVMGLWGIGGGIVSGPAQALYADSTPAGERSVYYHYLFVAYLVSSCLGPIVSIILFQTLGDEWNLYQLRIIIFVGLTMEAGNSVLMMFFDDSKALEEGDGAEGAATSAEATAETATTNQGSESPTEPEDCQEQGKSGSPPVSTTTLTTEETDLTQSLLAQEEVEPETNESSNAAAVEDQPTSSAQISPQGKQRLIPYILFFAGLIFSIGSGCTVKFFPLFFKEDVGMSPSQVQIVYVLVPICMALCSGVGTTLAPHLGRVETCLLLQTLGIGCLYAMVFCKSFLDSHPIVLVPVYILRTALMNCTYPLLESILMDFVPKNERARWKSLESVSQFGWCGSAALGGYVSDKWDYTHTFFVTATIQMVGNVFMFSLLPLVPRSEQALATNAGSDPSSSNNETESGDTDTQNRIQGSADAEDE